MIIDVMEDQYFRVKEQNKKLEDSLFWARNNYGFAQGKDDRVSRFLVMRRNSLAEEGDYMDAQVSEDNWRRRKIAEKRAKEAAAAEANGQEVHGKLDAAPEAPARPPPTALEVVNAFSKAELISKAVSLTTKEQVVSTTSAVFTDSLMTSIDLDERNVGVNNSFASLVREMLSLNVDCVSMVGGKRDTRNDTKCPFRSNNSFLRSFRWFVLVCA